MYDVVSLIIKQAIITTWAITVIATANNPSKINVSLLRSGRFDKIINFRYPNKEERKQLIIYYTRDKKISFDIDFDRLSTITSGFSCADIDNILNDATILAIRNNKKEINTNDVETAIDRLTSKSATISNLSDDDKKKIAIHEIGHAIGVLGHSNSINDLMYYSTASTKNTSPSLRDIDTVNKLYGF
jgi:cell division protease FtsH